VIDNCDIGDVVYQVKPFQVKPEDRLLKRTISKIETFTCFDFTFTERTEKKIFYYFYNAYKQETSFYATDLKDEVKEMFFKSELEAIHYLNHVYKVILNEHIDNYKNRAEQEKLYEE